VFRSWLCFLSRRRDGFELSKEQKKRLKRIAKNKERQDRKKKAEMLSFKQEINSRASESWRVDHFRELLGPDVKVLCVCPKEVRFVNGEFVNGVCPTSYSNPSN